MEPLLNKAPHHESMWEQEVQIFVYLTLALPQVSSQFHSSPILPLVKEPPYSLQGWVGTRDALDAL